MIPVAIIFPGQGAQKVGMGREFYEKNPAAKAVFDQAQEIIQNNFLDVIFNGPAEKLTSTAYCQPAILTASIAALRTLQSDSKFQNIKVSFACGLSLGEYSALIASGALSFEDGLRLVERRSFFMEEACKASHGKMAAIIGFAKEKLLEICKKTGAEVANFNSPEQIVITGKAQCVEAACEEIKAAGAKAVIPLDVSGAFHSTLMYPAAQKFEKELAAVSIQPPAFPVISNVTASPEETPEAIRQNLGLQITSSVRWEESVRFAAQNGVTTFLEVGPGTVLKGLIRKIDSNLRVYSIQSPEDINNLSI